MTSTALSPIIASLYVALGGAAGSLLRYQIGRAAGYFVGPASGFPWATLAINVVGSLAMGVLLGWLAKSNQSAPMAEAWRLAVGVGVLGGFTTFSAFSAEMVTLVHRGMILQCFAYGASSLLAGMAAFLIGLVLIQSAP
ncbi:MAG: fluoride efflux transporter CrcB [Pseudomonadota bacterium]